MNAIRTLLIKFILSNDLLFSAEILPELLRRTILLFLENPVEMQREPSYIRNVTYKDSNFIDTTYVEVDMTRQKMMFFREGEKILETDVVTGCTSKGMGTPELVCYVYGKR